MDWLLIVAIVVSFAFAVSRPFQPPHGIDAKDVYKDLAHIWVGILIGGGILYGMTFRVWWWDDFVPRNGNIYLILACSLTVVEVICGVWNRMRRSAPALSPDHARARDLKPGDVLFMYDEQERRQFVKTVLVAVETDRKSYTFRPDESVILEK